MKIYGTPPDGLEPKQGAGKIEAYVETNETLQACLARGPETELFFGILNRFSHFRQDVRRGMERRRDACGSMERVECLHQTTTRSI